MYKDILQKKHFRHEFKFTVECADKNRILQQIRNVAPTIKLAYDKRHINNLYFDTPHYCLFHQAKEGATPRAKIRLRWYGEYFCSKITAMLEFKLKFGEVGTKDSKEIKNFTYSDDSRWRDVKYLINSSNIPTEMLTALSTVRPSLSNRYERQYFQTSDKKIRLTVDRNLCFSRWRHFQAPQYPKIINPRLMVFELKFEGEDMLARNLMTICKNGLVRTQFSKYTYGLDSLRA